MRASCCTLVGTCSARSGPSSLAEPVETRQVNRKHHMVGNGTCVQESSEHHQHGVAGNPRTEEGTTELGRQQRAAGACHGCSNQIPPHWHVVEGWWICCCKSLGL